MKSCPKCSSTYADAVKFCPRDGAALEQRIGAIPDRSATGRQVCPTCGSAYDGGRFCMLDGSLLTPKSA